jgi:hypothetical protein
MFRQTHHLPPGRDVWTMSTAPRIEVSPHYGSPPTRIVGTQPVPQPGSRRGRCPIRLHELRRSGFRHANRSTVVAEFSHTGTRAPPAAAHARHRRATTRNASCARSGRGASARRRHALLLQCPSRTRWATFAITEEVWGTRVSRTRPTSAARIEAADYLPGQLAVVPLHQRQP